MSINHEFRRPVQQAARKWAALTGTNYTTAFRDVGSPLAQGILGDRLTVDRLLQVLDENPSLGEFGMNAPLNGAEPYLDMNGNIVSHFPLMFSRVAQSAEFLRMFTLDLTQPGNRASGVEVGVGSYTLKHTAEKFFGSYITNGQMILAALALGIPISHADYDDESPNVDIAIPDLEHTYLWNEQNRGPRTAHDYRPPRLELLGAALVEYRTTSGISAMSAADKRASVQLARWRQGDLRFHRWLIAQADRDAQVGRVAADYKYGTEQSEDPIARVPGDLVTILESYNADEPFIDNARMAISEWNAQPR